MNTAIDSAPPAASEHVDALGFGPWVTRVCERVDAVTALPSVADATPRQIKDIRTALRRVRSIVAAVRGLDDAPVWKKLNRAARTLFRAVGPLRDAHVSRGWLDHMHREGHVSDGVWMALRMDVLRDVRAGEKIAAEGLAAFDTADFLALGDKAAPSLAGLAPDGPVFEALAIARYREAWQMHQVAVSTGEAEAFHTLRVGIKRLRYVIENFLPVRHRVLKPSLKAAQTHLGDLHDVDLWLERLDTMRGLLPDAELDPLCAHMKASRDADQDAYLALCEGPSDVWTGWRTALPEGSGVADVGAAVLWRRVLGHRARPTASAALAGTLAQAMFEPSRAPTAARIATFVLDAQDARQAKPRLKRTALVQRLQDEPDALGWTPADMALLRGVLRRSGKARDVTMLARATMALRAADATVSVDDGVVHVRAASPVDHVVLGYVAQVVRTHGWALSVLVAPPAPPPVEDTPPANGPNDTPPSDDAHAANDERNTPPANGANDTPPADDAPPAHGESGAPPANNAPATENAGDAPAGDAPAHDESNANNAAPLENANDTPPVEDAAPTRRRVQVPTRRQSTTRATRAKTPPRARASKPRTTRARTRVAVPTTAAVPADAWPDALKTRITTAIAAVRVPDAVVYDAAFWSANQDARADVAAALARVLAAAQG